MSEPASGPGAGTLAGPGPKTSSPLAPPPSHRAADEPRSLRWLVFGGVGVCSLIIFFVMNPGMVLSSTTPSGGDMGAHVLGPAYLRDVLLPSGQFQGWSNSWFAGFPIFYFYFPLPSLVIVFLDLFLPYGVAFKLVSIAGLLGLAPATYFFARSLGFEKTVSTV